MGTSLDSIPLDWSQSIQSQLFLNPKTLPVVQEKWQRAFSRYCPGKGYLGVPTSQTSMMATSENRTPKENSLTSVSDASRASETTSHHKVVILSQEAFLASAQAVNFHLQASSSDIWLHVLPDFHVGGLSIWARGFLSGAKVFKPQEWSWTADHLISALNESRATLLSLVPTQIFDLVINRLSAPPHLRAVIVGGGALTASLYQEGRKLGWPILPSYGLTECSSQVATASLSTLSSLTTPSGFSLLSHVQVKSDPSGFLMIRSPALLEAYLEEGEKEGWSWRDPKEDGWFSTRDLGRVEGDRLHFHGRGDDQIKILGELVNMSVLRSRLISVVQHCGWSQEVTIQALPHPRQEWELVLFYARSLYSLDQVEDLLKRFNHNLMPYQQIRRHQGLAYIPRSGLGKILFSGLSRQMGYFETATK